MPWRIAEADLENARCQTNLVALVRSRGVELAQTGTGDFIGRCPFHDDQGKSSFIVTPATVALPGLRTDGQRDPVCPAA